jgi:predicted HTH domain antitoxin
MLLSVELPDAIAAQLHLDGEAGSRRVLEIFALEGYRAGDLSRGQVGELLGLSFYETEAFLKTNRASIEYSLEEHDRDTSALQKLLGR